MDIEIEKYHDRYWAVYVNKSLLAVTVYKKGAEEIRNILSAMSDAQATQQNHTGSTS